MRTSKRILKKRKFPNYLQSVVTKEGRETPSSEPQKNQTASQFAYSEHQYAERILQLSQNGCKITTEAPLRLGDVIKFQSPFTMRGRVVWSQGALFGIAFID